MPEADVELVRGWFELRNGGDIDAFMELFGDDAEVIPDPAWMEAGPFAGRKAIRDWYEGLRDSWDTERVVLGEIFELGGQVLARLDWKVRGRTSGIDVAVEITSVVSVRGGRIVRQQFFFDDAVARQAIQEGG